MIKNIIFRNQKNIFIHPQSSGAGFTQPHGAGAGFTLVELLVTIGIIGILATMLTVSFSGMRQHARDAQRISDVTEVQKQLQIFFQSNEDYPPTGGLNIANKNENSIRLGLYQGIASNVALCKDGSFVQDSGACGAKGIEIKIIPADPRAGDGFDYYYASDGADYRIFFTLETGVSNVLKGERAIGPQGIN